MAQSNSTCAAALGALGGLVGTLTMQPLLMMVQKWFPQGSPPLRRDPGEFMVAEAESLLSRNVRRQIPSSAETAVARSLALGYGVGFGALYGVTAPQTGSMVSKGMALGAITWAAGYLGWLPATGLMQPVWRQSAAQTSIPLAEHLIYGITTVAVYEGLSRHFGNRA